MSDRLTIYDVFAVLIPGAVFNFLLLVTTRDLAGLDVFDWSGGIGDATALIITGYASGVLLQAVGHAFTHSEFWRAKHPSSAIVRIILDDGNRSSAEFREEVVRSIQKDYGQLPDASESTYNQILRERSQRIYKRVERDDASVSRFLAEVHQMRAYAIAFMILALVAFGSYFLNSSEQRFFTHLTIAVAYGALMALAIWRMVDKDRTLGFHVLVRYLEANGSATPAHH